MPAYRWFIYVIFLHAARVSHVIQIIQTCIISLQFSSPSMAGLFLLAIGHVPLLGHCARCRAIQVFLFAPACAGLGIHLLACALKLNIRPLFNGDIEINARRSHVNQFAGMIQRYCGGRFLPEFCQRLRVI